MGRTFNQPIVRLIALGLITELLYLSLFALRFPLLRHYATLTDLGGLTNYDPLAFIAFVGGFAVLFALYWFTCWVAEEPKHDSSTRWRAPIVIGFGVIFAATLLFMYPITAIDIYGYIVRTRMLTVHQANPLLALPSDYANDKFFPYIGGWKDWPTPYGPLFILIATIPSRLAGDNLMMNLLLFKALAFGAHLGNIALLWLVLRHQPVNTLTNAVTFYTWNPLVIFEALGNGHNDVVMMVFVLLSMYMLAKKYFVGAVIALMLSALIKYASLLLMPIIVVYALSYFRHWRDRLLEIAKISLASGAVLLALYLPFWQGPAVFKGFLGQADIFISSPPTIALLLIEPYLGAKYAATVVKVATSVLFAAIYLLVLAQTDRRFERLVLRSATILSVYLLIACSQFESWYIVWPVALAALSPNDHLRKMLIALAFGSLLSVAAFAFIWPWTGASFLIINIVAVAAIIFPPIALCAYWLARFCRAARHPGAPRIAKTKSMW